MVTVIKKQSLPGLEIIPCRLDGPRGVVKCFLLHDDKQIVLVDSGHSESDAKIIEDRLSQLGAGVEDLTACIITHAHGDHTGGLSSLRTKASLTLLAHAAEADAIVEKAGVPVDRHIGDGDELDLVGGLRVIHMPGHTMGSVALYWGTAQALVAGDSMVSAGEHLIVSPPFLSEDPDLARASVERLLGTVDDIEMVLVAHGDDVHTNAKQPLGNILAEQRAI